jgi:hypothetical protein
MSTAPNMRLGKKLAEEFPGSRRVFYDLKKL